MIFFTVFKQVIILFILIFTGVFLAKKNIFTENAVKSVTDIVLYLVSPCVIIKSFIRKCDMEILKNVLLSFLVAAVVHIVFIVVANILLHDKDDARKRVLRFGAVFGNCGFMSLPIQQAILGDLGVLYCASFIAVFNVFSWTYGIAEMSGNKSDMSVKKIFLNPGVIATAIGFIIFSLSIPVPEVVSMPIGYFAALNTPVPMLVIGYHLSKSNLRNAISDANCFISCLAKLIILPVAALSIIYLIGIRGDLFVSTAISASSPVAAYTTMFSYKFKKATNLSVNLVSLSTLLSLLTIPVIVALAQKLA